MNKPNAHNAVVVIRRGDASYPLLLAEIHDPPEHLFLRSPSTPGAASGMLPPGDYFAVVGTRTPTPYGRDVTPKLVGPLAEAGLIIVSGLAYGIDALAHEAALAVGGKTVAVLGTGVDDESLYPQAHRKLAQRIVDSGGAVVSEYPPGTAGHPGHFPARNRIIAGLSRGVLVIEAREKSGALITARLALSENRDVFAVPGQITSAASAGPNRLLREGATPVLSATDILEEYGVAQPPSNDLKLTTTLTDDERRVLDILAEGAVHVDALGKKFAMPPAELSALLVTLELKGLVRNLGGGRYGLGHL